MAQKVMVTDIASTAGLSTLLFFFFFFRVLSRLTYFIVALKAILSQPLWKD